MSLLLYRGITVDNDEVVMGMLSLKNGNEPYIGGCRVKPETVNQCTGMFDRNHISVYEDDLISYNDLVYRIVRNPKDKSLGKLLLFDLVRNKDNVIALKLHKPLIPIEELPDHIESLDRAFVRSAEIIGDIYTFSRNAKMIDASKVTGDKDAAYNKLIDEAVAEGKDD